MRIRVQKGTILKHAPVEVTDVTYVIFFEEKDNTPLTVVEHLGRDVVHVTHCNDPEFQIILRRLGVENVPTPVLPDTAVKA